MNVGSFFRNFVLVVLSMAGGRFVRENPILFGFKAASMPFTTSLSTEQQHDDDNLFPAIITSHPVLDAVLKHHEGDIVGDDYEAYRNHCLRVMNFAVYYHGIEQQNCQPPPTPSNSEKAATPTATTTTSISSMTEQELNVVALGVAYHDIGLWTPNGGALAYLEPSVFVLEQEIYVAGTGRKKNKKQHAWYSATASLPTFTISDLATAREIILQHHKFTAWKQAKEDETNVVNAALVNAVRRGDWADATMGIVRSGMSPIYLETVYNAIPTRGFHDMLLGMCSRLSPNSWLGQLDVLKILKW